MQWRWQWFLAGLGGLAGLGLVRSVLRILTPVAATGVAAYGLMTLLMRDRRDAEQRTQTAHHVRR